MDSFISWVGGKKALRKKILEQFPADYGRYIEAFGGAGWLLFAEERKGKLEVYNDMDGNLVNLFRCVKRHPDALQEELDWLLNSREMFFDAKEEARGLTDIERAARFFYSNQRVLWRGPPLIRSQEQGHGEGRGLYARGFRPVKQSRGGAHGL